MSRSPPKRSLVADHLFALLGGVAIVGGVVEIAVFVWLARHGYFNVRFVMIGVFNICFGIPVARWGDYLVSNLRESIRDTKAAKIE